MQPRTHTSASQISSTVLLGVGYFSSPRFANQSRQKTNVLKIAILLDFQPLHFLSKPHFLFGGAVPEYCNMRLLEPARLLGPIRKYEKELCVLRCCYKTHALDIALLVKGFNYQIKKL